MPLQEIQFEAYNACVQRAEKEKAVMGRTAKTKKHKINVYTLISSGCDGATRIVVAARSPEEARAYLDKIRVADTATPYRWHVVPEYSSDEPMLLAVQLIPRQDEVDRARAWRVILEHRRLDESIAKLPKKPVKAAAKRPAPPGIVIKNGFPSNYPYQVSALSETQ